MEERRREPQLQYDDEISLVDLAATFLRRRRVFYAVVLAALLAGIVYAVLIPERYDYASLVKLAEKAPGNYIDNPAATIATLENRWLPEYQSTYFAEHDRPIPFKVRFENPESTGLIRLVSEASPSQAEAVKQIHTQLIDELAEAQSAALTSLKQNLERQIESLSSTIQLLEGSADAGAAIAATVEKRLSLEATLNSMQPIEILVVSRASAERKGPARSLIVLLAGLLGLMGGVFLAFFTEFASLVKAQLAEM